MQECELTEFRKPIFEQLKSLEEQKLEVEKQLRMEKGSKFTYSIQKMIINSLINKVYVYETNFNKLVKDIIIKMLSIEELDKTFNDRPSKIYNKVSNIKFCDI